MLLGFNNVNDESYEMIYSFFEKLNNFEVKSNPTRDST